MVNIEQELLPFPGDYTDFIHYDMIRSVRGPGKSRRNWVLLADLIADGHMVTVNYKVSRFDLAFYLYRVGREKTVWGAYLKVLRNLHFLDRDINLVGSYPR